MWSLVAIYDNVSQDEIGGPFVSHPSEEVVAHFTSEKKARDYLKASRLKHPKRGFCENFPFRESSLLSGANDAEIHEVIENNFPIDPKL